MAEQAYLSWLVEHRPLLDLPHPPVLAQPCEGTVSDPAPRQNLKTPPCERTLPVDLPPLLGPSLCPDPCYLLRGVDFRVRCTTSTLGLTPFCPLLAPPRKPASTYNRERHGRRSHAPNGSDPIPSCSAPLWCREPWPRGHEEPLCAHPEMPFTAAYLLLPARRSLALHRPPGSFWPTASRVFLRWAASLMPTVPLSVRAAQRLVTTRQRRCVESRSSYERSSRVESREAKDAKHAADDAEDDVRDLAQGVHARRTARLRSGKIGP
jgi:hypothetical protein